MDSGTPASANRVQNVCRRSWSRQETPERDLTRSQPELMSVTGFSGVVGCGDPNGKTQCSGCGSPNRLTNQARCEASTLAKSSLIGITRPVPLEVFARPTVIVRSKRLTCRHRRLNASPEPRPVSINSGIALRTTGERNVAAQSWDWIVPIVVSMKTSHLLAVALAIGFSETFRAGVHVQSSAASDVHSI